MFFTFVFTRKMYYFHPRKRLIIESYCGFTLEKKTKLNSVSYTSFNYHFWHFPVITRTHHKTNTVSIWNIFQPQKQQSTVDVIWYRKTKLSKTKDYLTEFKLQRSRTKNKARSRGASRESECRWIDRSLQQIVWGARVEHISSTVQPGSVVGTRPFVWR